MTLHTTKDRIAFLLALISQIEKWSQDEIEAELFSKLYLRGVVEGKYDDCENTEEQAKIIAEHDFFWSYMLVDEKSEEYESVKSSYIRNGLGEYETEKETEITEIVAEHDGNFLVYLSA